MAAEYDYIVVGSGAGGGPLACNLALAPEGYRVALLEAGPESNLSPDNPTFYNHAIPGLHARSTEDPAMSWEFFVRHYSDDKRHKADSKFDAQGDGIFYPRAAAVGGCTAHHAMISLYPHNADWKFMADLTGDPSWSADNMRKLFQRLEVCQYLVAPSKDAPADKQPDPADDPRHGHGGWLPLSMPDPTLALDDKLLLQILLRAFLAVYRDALTASGKTGDAIADAVKELLRTLKRTSKRVPAVVDDNDPVVEREVRRLTESAKQQQDEGADAKTILDLAAKNESLIKLFRQAYSRLDPNRWMDDAKRVGAFNTPASILQGVRTGVRERIRDVRALYPERLNLICGALVTEVIIEQGKAVGVRYLPKEGLYQATPQKRLAGSAPKSVELRVRPEGEVILAGGAFNTPQLLMLSGVGPKDQLDKHGIAVKCELPGVGRNLQDRYEVTLVTELPESERFKVLDGLTFRAPGEDGKPAKASTDPGFREWLNHRGVYATNGVVMTIIKRSKHADGDIPDLFIFGLPGYFRGYAKGYSAEIQSEKQGDRWVENHRRFTWVILKGKTRNRGGFVRLSSKDPLSRPEINFRYFDEGSKDWEKDLDALVEGVRFMRGIMDSTGLGKTLLVPKREILDDKTNEKLREHIKQEAWGHHACGTCKIGKDDDPEAVLDGDFRVRGVRNLRVVDASVFPEIPGFFIVTSIFMISEKASDAILADRRSRKPKKWPEPARK